MLQGMIARGATIFLTSHVLEIVERLCSHIAIIDHGRIVAHGSLEELRAGVQAKLASTEVHEAGADANARLTLEQIFLSVVGKDSNDTAVREGELAWLS
jgi:ABC-2 type transport system ATP-binding protein